MVMARDAFRFLPLFLPGAQTARQPEWQPSVDVYRSRNGWLVKFDLAGVHPKDVEWSVAGNALTVRGARRDSLMEEGCRHYHMEITYSRFERRVEVPGDLSSARITTEYRDGMLLVRIEEAGT